MGNRQTALHHAAAGGYFTTVHLLLLHKRDGEGGIDVNAQDSEGNTALHLAACNGCAQVAGLLFDEGWRIHVETDNKAGQSALTLATQNGHTSVVKCFEEKMATKKTAVGVENGIQEALAFDQAREARRAEEARQAAGAKA
eukprot:GDKK01068248.1.p1 GENE.GDKK01068248.1~~GDKK01068248.1.p1  ORF type:complete len:141 (-),score=6.18 GDKK01068248.1:111-533(-)